jgi:hypothetical protein
MALVKGVIRKDEGLANAGFGRFIFAPKASKAL